MATMIWLDPQWAERLLLNDADFARVCWSHAGIESPSEPDQLLSLAALARGSRLCWLEDMRQMAPQAPWPAWPFEWRVGVRIERALRGARLERLRSWWSRRLQQQVLTQALAALLHAAPQQIRLLARGMEVQGAEIAGHAAELQRQAAQQSAQSARLTEQEQALATLAMRSAAHARELGLPDEPALNGKLAHYYQAFEAFFRGEGLDWAAHYAHYQAWIDRLPQEAGAPCVDLGCGRGEWLQHLRQQGRSVQGVELNPGFAAQCRQAGLPVSETDALAWLQACGDGQVAAISAFHLVEHLPFAELFQIIEQAARVLQPGGGLLLETPNPENPLVGSHTFYHDPTHRHPVTPSSLQFLLRYHGFTDLQVVRTNPYPPQDQLTVHDPLTDRLNGLLCGPQDYAVLAFKPSA